ncbi:LysR family transcriptional regulator [Paenibacillus sp. FA6]|uniref:LysR family transcriptional regulator n=1 Tax=Paenibacillus sp. FA6 TaxID=3413029 RepID=UPI003F658E99
MILVHIEKYKKVTDVAREMNMKQPSVTFHMKSLEEELGTVLFESKRGRMVLTEAGQALYPYALKITGLAAEAKKVVQDYTLLDKGTLRIGADCGTSTFPLPQLITAFTKRHTGIQLQVIVTPTQTIRTLLSDREIDVALYHAKVQQLSDEELTTTQSIFDDEIVVIFGANHRFANLQHLEPQLIAMEFFIQHAEGSFVKQFTHEWSNNNNIHLWERIQLDSPEAIKISVQAGHHITFFPKRSVQQELELGVLKCLPIPNDTTAMIKSVIAFQHDPTQHSLRNEFVEFARNYTL